MRIARGLGRRHRRGIGGGSILEWECAPERAWHVQYGYDKAGYERAEEAQRSKGTCVTYHADGGERATDAVGGGAIGGGRVGNGVVKIPPGHFSGKRRVPEGELVRARDGRGDKGGTRGGKGLARVWQRVGRDERDNSQQHTPLQLDMDAFLFLILFFGFLFSVAQAIAPVAKVTIELFPIRTLFARVCATPATPSRSSPPTTPDAPATPPASDPTISCPAARSPTSPHQASATQRSFCGSGSSPSSPARCSPSAPRPTHRTHRGTL